MYKTQLRIHSHIKTGVLFTTNHDRRFNCPSADDTLGTSTMAEETLITKLSSSDVTNYSSIVHNYILSNRINSSTTSSSLPINPGGLLTQTTILTSDEPSQNNGYFVAGLSAAISIVFISVLFVIFYCKRKKQSEIKKTAAMWCNVVSKQTDLFAAHPSRNDGPNAKDTEAVTVHQCASVQFAPGCTTFIKSETNHKLNEISDSTKIDVRDYSSGVSVNEFPSGTSMYLMVDKTKSPCVLDKRESVGYEKIDKSHPPCISNVKNVQNGATSFCDEDDSIYAEITGLKDLANKEIEMKTFGTKKMCRQVK